MIVRRGIVLAAAGLALALGACTDGDPTPTTSTTTLSAPSTTSAKPVPPTLPAEAQAATTKGAADFFRHFIDLYNYGYHELDNQPLLAVSDQECDFCRTEASNISDGAGRNYTNIGGDLTVTTAVAAPGDPTKGLIVNAVVEQAAGHSEDPAGKTVENIPPSKNVRIDARVRWDGTRWHVVAVRVLKGADQ